MNEQIKELAKQSGIWFVTDRGDLLGDFAELIIEECYGAVNNSLYHDYVFDNHTPAEIRKIALLAIKKHFGVE